MQECKRSNHGALVIKARRGGEDLGENIRKIDKETFFDLRRSK